MTKHFTQGNINRGLPGADSVLASINIKCDIQYKVCFYTKRNHFTVFVTLDF